MNRALLVPAAVVVALAVCQLGAQQPAPAPTFAPIAARVAASVVRVELEGERVRGDLPRRRLLREVAAPDRGAGIVVGPDLVLTHASLADLDQPAFEVTTAQGRRMGAALARLDPSRELAILRTATPLGAPVAQLGSSRSLRTGGLVLALGDPFGAARDAAPTVTLGVLEGRARLVAPETTYAGEVLLTCAALNPGSEGGPLVDLEGRVVGVLAPLARDRRSGALAGHAVPIEVARAVLEDLARGDAAPSAARLGLDGRGDGRGVVVLRLAADGPAAKAGVQPGDRVLALGDDGVATSDDLHRALARRRGGERVALVVEREAKILTLEVELGGDR